MRDISCYWIIFLIKHQTGLHNPKNKSIAISGWWPDDQFLQRWSSKHAALDGRHVTLQKRNWCLDISDILCVSEKGSLFGRRGFGKGDEREEEKRAGSVSDASLYHYDREEGFCLDMLNKLLYPEFFWGGTKGESETAKRGWMTW